MHIDEILAWRRTPMSDHQRLYVREFQRLLQQRILIKVNLADRQIVGRSPIGIHLMEQFRRERFCFHGSISRFQKSTERDRPALLISKRPVAMPADSLG